MISASVFAQRYTSIWRDIAPMSGVFVRYINEHLLVREAGPLSGKSRPSRHGFLNEVAFALFCAKAEASWKARLPFGSNAVSGQDWRRAVATARSKAPLSQAFDRQRTPSLSEKNEVILQYTRLAKFVNKLKGGTIEVEPKFPGCGYLSSCMGDFIVTAKKKRMLFEIKAGDRGVRSSDLRQLLVYLALNELGRQVNITHVGIINPRTGTSFLTIVDDFCWEMAGRNRAKLLSDVVEIVSITGESG